MNTRLVLVGLSLFCASLVAAPAAAQVYTGRIDVTIKDGTGAVLPGVTVEAVGTQTDVAVTDAQGEAHFVNLAPGRYTVTAKLSGLHRLPERERAGQRRLDRAARRHDGRRRPGGAGRRHAGNAGHRDEAADRLDQRQPRRAPEHPERARSVGRAPDRPRHHRRSRERRRRRIGPAVELPGQGRQPATRTRGTWTASRSPTWARSARRRPTTTSTCSRRCRSRPAAPIRPTPRRACS